MKFIQRLLALMFLATALLATPSAYAAEAENQHHIKAFIQAVHDHYAENIAQCMVYPLQRGQSIPSVKNSEEMIARFDEVFDPTLVEMITSSDPEKDWDTVGWRGTMFRNGMIWMDDDGKITAINYQSDMEKKRAKQLLEAERATLHASVKKFHKPMLQWQTSKFRIRVDDLGEGKYRYASWAIDKPFSDEPSLILYDGILTVDGSGGNAHYTFKKGTYTYVLDIVELGEQPSSLNVYKSGKLVLHDPVIQPESLPINTPPAPQTPAAE